MSAVVECTMKSRTYSRAEPKRDARMYARAKKSQHDPAMFVSDGEKPTQDATPRMLLWSEHSYNATICVMEESGVNNHSSVPLPFP